jgi:hypothetical protein
MIVKHTKVEPQGIKSDPPTTHNLFLLLEMTQNQGVYKGKLS